METILVFTHRLDLALRLVDTTSGRNIPGRNVSVLIDGEEARFSSKPDDVLIFQNLKKRQFLLETRSRHFEDCSAEVDLDSYGTKVPLLELQLIPSREYPGSETFLELSGILPGITELSAIWMGDKTCLAREFDPRKRNLQLFNPHHLAMERTDYAMVNPDEGIFEPFRIVSQINDQAVKVEKALEMEIKNYFPIVPIVHGKIFPDGRYCLRARNNTSNPQWLVRWVCGEEAHFRLVDFRAEEAPRLEEGGG